MPEKTTVKKRQSLVNRFLKDLMDTQKPVSVYLVSGFQLKGQIVEFDEGSVLFKSKDVHQLVMRSAVATMYPLSRSRDGHGEWWQTYAPAAAEDQSATTKVASA